MNILLSAFTCDPTKGSENSNGWYWATGIASRGYTTHCFTRMVGKNGIESKGKQENLIFHYVRLPYGFENLYGKSSLGMYLYYILWQWYTYQEAKRIHKLEIFSLAHHVTWGSLQQGSFLYKLGIPFIFGPAGGGQKSPKAFKAYFGKSWKQEVLRNLISNFFILFNPACKRMVRNAKVVLVSNTDTLKVVNKIGTKNVDFSLDAALPQSFYPKEFIPKQSNKNHLKLLWVGRFMPRKGLLLVLDVMKELKEYMDITLTIVGDGEIKEEVLGKIKEYELENTVEWKGKVPFEEVKLYYSNHDLFFFTSLRDSCPAQLIEAMAYGLPVITLKLHGQALIVSETTGIACSCENPEKAIINLKEAILSFYNQDANITEMSIASHTFASQQTWDKKIDLIVNKYYPNK